MIGEMLLYLIMAKYKNQLTKEVLIRKMKILPAKKKYKVNLVRIIKYAVINLTKKVKLVTITKTKTKLIMIKKSPNLTINKLKLINREEVLKLKQVHLVQIK